MYIRRPLCILCAVFAAILFIFANICPPKPSIDTKAVDNAYLTVTGTVTDKSIKSKNIYVTLKNCNICTSEKKVLFCLGLQAAIPLQKYDFNLVKIGQKIEIGGIFNEYKPPSCEGEFNSKRYYSIRQIDGLLKECNILSLSKTYNRPKEKLCQISQKASRILEENMSEEDYGVLNALILGKKQDIDPTIKDAYTRAGISHILSLSGLHMATLGMGLIKILKKAGVNIHIASLTSGILITGYALLTGLSTSTLRALIMFVLCIIAGSMQRTYDLKSAASFSCITILLNNPYYILDTGFQLSFGAIMGISFICPAITVAFQSFRMLLNKPARFIFDSLTMSIGICLATLPITASAFFTTSRYGFILNLIVIPLMSFVLLFGLSGLVIGYVTGVLFAGRIVVYPKILDFMRDTCFSITHVILTLYRNLADRVSLLPGNTLVCGKPSFVQIIIYYLLIVIALLLIDRLYARENGPELIDRYSLCIVKNSACSCVKITNKITHCINSINPMFIGLIRKCRLNVVMIFAISVVILTNKNTPNFQICNFSVGQGDCALVFAKNSPVILIDAGSLSEKQAGRYKLIPSLLSKGISHLDYVFISHLDEDHISSVFEILEDPGCGIIIDRIVLSKYCVISNMHTPCDNYNKLNDICKKNKIPIQTISQGNDIENNEIKISCLWPTTYNEYNTGIIDTSCNADANEASMVLKIIDKKTGFIALFTGDINKNAEEALCGCKKNNLLQLNSNYLKVAHHGSRDSSCNDFLDEVSPNIAVISVGDNNSYGHPHKETIERLNNRQIKTYRTDRDGETILTVKRNGTVKMRCIGNKNR